MGFERIESFKRLAQEYKGEKDLNQIALDCKASATKGWVKVRNNNKKVWEGEQRKEILDENGNIKEIWMYRPLDNYDQVLFSVLYCSLLKPIYFNWKKIYNWVDVDDYLDSVYDWLCQTIRHYTRTIIRNNKEVKCSFKTLASTMISNCAVNLINRNTTITRVRDKDGKIIDKKVKYHLSTRSLNEILDNPKDYDNYNLPQEDEISISFIPRLKEKYKERNDFLTWAFLDLQEDNSELLAVKSLFENDSKFKFSKTSLERIFNKVKENDIYKEFGFTDNVKNTNISFNQLYKRSIALLQNDMKQNILC